VDQAIGAGAAPITLYSLLLNLGNVIATASGGCRGADLCQLL